MSSTRHGQPARMFPRSHRPVGNPSPSMLDGLERDVKMTLAQLVEKGYTEEALDATITALMAFTMVLNDHLDQQERRLPVVIYSFDYLYVNKNDQLAVRHIWGYVLGFIEASMLTGADLEKMMDGIINVAKGVSEMLGETAKTCITEENEAKKGIYFCIQY